METEHAKDIPFNGLSFVSAVCRYKNFTSASQALHVTPSAVSKKIAQVEARLGMILFDRRAGGIEPTEAARALAAAFDRASDQLAAAIEDVRPQAGTTTLRVAAPTSFAMRWLMPRLWHHARRHPGVCVDVIPTHAVTPLSAVAFDVAIRHTAVRDDAEGGALLMSEQLGLLVHPSLLEGRKRAGNGALSEIALIESQSRPGELDAWSARLAGRVRLSRERRRYPHFYIALEAALAGQGAVVGPLATLSDLIRKGYLAEPLPEHRLPGADIVAFAASKHRDRPAERDFIAWAADQARQAHG